MERIGERSIWTLFDGADELQVATNSEIRRNPAHVVSDFLDLAKKVANLQYRNPGHVLLFRGQKSDHQFRTRKGAIYSSIKPSLFRPKAGKDGIASEALLARRFGILGQAEQELIDHYSDHDNFEGIEGLRRHRILRWAILQHYEVCLTPLLDVTQSLRVAASFASMNASQHAFIYVLGVPNISGSVTASAEAGVEIIRLSSVCPPVAVRPHIQEGFLLGEYPEMPDISQKQNYATFEIDFSRRLIAKLRFNPKSFWKKNPLFPKIEHGALYPDEHDPLYALTSTLKQSLGTQDQ